jgi:sporulation protein YhbH
MTIVFHDDWKINKGTKDAARHRQKVDKAIRDNIQNVIGEESIITRRDGKKTVKVPVRGLRDFQFKYGKKGVAGVGQGDKKAGDILDERATGGQGGGAGSEAGRDFLETEVDIDYLIQIMFEDLGLPYLEDKDKNSTIISKGWKSESVSKVGPQSRIHKKRTMLEAIKRNAVFSGEVMAQTGCTIEDAARALKQAKFDLLEAIAIIKEGRLNGDTEAAFAIDDVDLRYKTIEEDIEICSNAVVIAKMDVSGSMDIKKKYLVRSLLFWMVEFLKSQYEHVQIRFIQHADTAKEVDEDTFFHRGTTGGTFCHTAIDKAIGMIDAEYPTDEWNIYSLYCSDGEDFREDLTVSSIEDLIKRVNMFSYIEVKPESDYSNLMPAIKKKWKFDERKIGGEGNFWINHDKHFFMSVIRNKKHIRKALQHMLATDLKKYAERTSNE